MSSVGGRSGDRFQSPSAQRDAIEGWAKAHGVRIAVIHEDLDKSGGTMNRPGMNEALRRIDAGESGGLVCAKLDRFARTLIGGLTVIADLNKKGARVVSVAESLDPATPMGRAMMGVLLIMAEWQRDQANEHIAAAQIRAAEGGRYAVVPMFGLVRDAAGQTVIDEDAAYWTQHIFQQRADGVGWGTIAAELDAANVKPPRGGDRWAKSTLASMVKSEGALGVWNGPRGIRVEDAWPALVTRELWDRANAIVGASDNDLKHDDRLLLNIARCAECVRPLRRVVNPEGFVSYACQTRGCKGRGSIGVQILDTYVSGLIDERLSRFALAPRLVDDDGEGQRLQVAADTAVADLEAWRDDLGLRQALGQADWRQGLIDRAAARDAAVQAVTSAQMMRGVPEFALLPDGGVPCLADLEWEDRREVAKDLLYGVFLRKSTVRGPGARRHVAPRVRVVWNGEPDLPELPSHHGPVPAVRWEPM